MVCIKRVRPARASPIALNQTSVPAHRFNTINMHVFYFILVLLSVWPCGSNLKKVFWTFRQPAAIQWRRALNNSARPTRVPVALKMFFFFKLRCESPFFSLDTRYFAVVDLWFKYGSADNWGRDINLKEYAICEGLQNKN